MSQFIAAIEMGDVRRLVVYSLDRLTRRMLHFQQLLKLFERQSVTLAVVNDPSFSDNAAGRLMANIIAAANEFQLDLTKERMADMRAAYKRDGKRVAGRVPFGYQTDPATKQLVVNEEQARRVNDFFELAAGGSRPSDLAGSANLQRWPDQKGTSASCDVQDAARCDLPAPSRRGPSGFGIQTQSISSSGWRSRMTTAAQTITRNAPETDSRKRR
jgi:hypothetical protein